MNVSSVLMSRKSGKSQHPRREALSQPQSLSPLCEVINIKRPERPQTLERIVAFLRFSLDPTAGGLQPRIVRGCPPKGQGG
jgi:hypothetical protein